MPQLVFNVCVSALQLFDVLLLALDVGTVLLVALLQRAAQLVRPLQILTELLHVGLSCCHRLLLKLSTKQETL